MSKKARIIEFDILKGIGIISVVLTIYGYRLVFKMEWLQQFGYT